MKGVWELNKENFAVIEAHMLSCMNDGAHDEQHIYRVLYAALDIAAGYEIDHDVLIAAALLHDIGREAQFKNPKLDHAIVGSGMAYAYLVELAWPEEKARHVKECIATHRYRKNCDPETMEAKILFDADKLDVTGTIGIARTLAYKGIVGEPLYSLREEGTVSDGDGDEEPSFFQEYQWKLRKVYDTFYTERARQLAEGRRETAVAFYRGMLTEVTDTHREGMKRLAGILE
jgi:uncharacterized protein